MSDIIDQSQPIPVTLTVDQWQLAVRLINASALSLLNEIQRQCMMHSRPSQMGRQPMPGAGTPPQRPFNGEDAAP